MEVVNKKIVLVLIIIGIVSSVFIWQNISDNKTILEEVALNLNEKNNMFAIMLEQEDGIYKESEESTWPTSAVYMYDDTRSGCMDANGNKIENALTYDSENKIASVKTEKTSYCYLYFSIPKICETGTQVGECLLNNPTLALNTSMEGGLYRYQGSVADNYICFGTSDIDECLNNKDKYLYRIIGIDENNQLKLIKNSSLGKYAWHNANEDIIWSNSDLFKKLNGLNSENLTSIFVDNSTYNYVETDNEWYNKIASVDWKYGDTTDNGNYNAETMYAIENGWADTINAKIGLMYIHDYYYAYGIGGNPGNNTEAMNAWIFLGQNWTMSRYGWSLNGNYYVWGIFSYGSPNLSTPPGGNIEVCPVFYATANIQYKHGLGTIDNPLIIY